MPGEALAEGIPMSKFVRDGTNILVRAFQEYVAPDPPLPQEVPGFDTMDMTIFPFQYELMVGEQLREAGDNEPPDYTTPIRFDYEYIFAKLAPLTRFIPTSRVGLVLLRWMPGKKRRVISRRRKGRMPSIWKPGKLQWLLQLVHLSVLLPMATPVQHL